MANPQTLRMYPFNNGSTSWAAIPLAPSITATAISSNTIRINITDNSSNETAFSLERSLTGTGGWTVVTNSIPANATSYDDTVLQPGTTYYYRVRALSPSGNSNYSNITNAVTGPASEGEALFFFDDFASGNLTKQYSGNDFWLSGVNSSVVSQKLRLRWAAGTSMAEQRWSTRNTMLTDLWIKYDLTIPSNYVQGSSNNKGIIMLWSNPTNSTANDDGYSDPNTLLFSVESIQNSPANNGSAGAVRVSGSGYDYNAANASIMPNVIAPADIGTTVTYIQHIKAATFQPSAPAGDNTDWPLTGDGVYEVWKNGTLCYRRTTMNLYKSGFTGWNRGYLGGWANAPYASQTDLIYDNIEIASANIWGVS